MNRQHPFFHLLEAQSVFAMQNYDFAENNPKNYSVLCDFFVLFVAKDYCLNLKTLLSQSATLSMPNMIVSSQIAETERWVSEVETITYSSSFSICNSQFSIPNMNGWLDEPVFFSQDKYVVNCSYTQSYYCYTYARNNPLMYTDPMGKLCGLHR